MSSFWLGTTSYNDEVLCAYDALGELEDFIGTMFKSQSRRVLRLLEDTGLVSKDSDDTWRIQTARDGEALLVRLQMHVEIERDS